MGYAMDFLIPAAILYANPGLTREEYAEVLRCVRFPMSRLVLDDFEDSGGEYANSKYATGLFSIARILGLKQTEEYKKHSKPIKDKNGLYIYAPRVTAIVKSVVGAFLEPTYEVTLHLQNNIITPKKDVEVYRHVDNKDEKFESGSVIAADEYQWFASQAEWLILEVLDQEFCPEEVDKSNFPISYDEYGIPGDLVHAHLRVLEFTKDFEKLDFPDLDSLTASYPIFHPDQIWDWSQEEGDIFLSYFINPLNGIHWTKRNKRYYIDFSPMVSEKIYTSIRVTMAAIKRGAMSAFAYQSTEGHYWPKLKTNFPEINQENTDAIIDYWTSQYAIQKGLSISEWLRKNTMLIAKIGKGSLRDVQIRKIGRYQ